MTPAEINFLKTRNEQLELENKKANEKIKELETRLAEVLALKSLSR